MTKNSEKKQTMEADPQMILIIELVDKDFIIGIINVKIRFHKYGEMRNFNK